MQKAYEICKEMIQLRNYEIIDFDNDRLLCSKPDGNEMCVFVCNNTKFNIDVIQEFICMMKKMDLKHSIIVYEDSLTPVAKKIMEECLDMNIELFSQDELQYNITKHYLVPPHELAYKKSSDEYNAFKQKFANIPTLLKSDPVSRFFGFEK